jgi:hypothetical protein
MKKNAAAMAQLSFQFENESTTGDMHLCEKECCLNTGFRCYYKRICDAGQFSSVWNLPDGYEPYAGYFER